MMAAPVVVQLARIPRCAKTRARDDNQTAPLPPHRAPRFGEGAWILLGIAHYSDASRASTADAKRRIVIPSARFWREESGVLHSAEMQIPRFARDDNREKCPYIVRSSAMLDG